MPSRLRPTAPISPDAILVGDPGRALMLAQELLKKPKMSNHARGLWGYGGRTPDGRNLTIQATGMGGPSAAVVLGDLAKLGVRRAIRIGTAVALDADVSPGEVVVVSAAIAAGGSAAAVGVGAGDAVSPDPDLTAALVEDLGSEAGSRTIASFDYLPTTVEGEASAAVGDMQTATLFGRARELDLALAAVLVVNESSDRSGRLADDALEPIVKRIGTAASRVLSP